MGCCTRRVSISLVTAVLVAVTLNIAAGDPGAATPPAPKKTFYADPVKGSTSKGDGSKAKPWGSLQSIVEAKLINGSDVNKGKVHAGDLIYLMTGNHGSVTLWGPAYKNTSFIFLQPAPGQKPVLNSLALSNCARWVVRGLSFENPSVVTDRKPLLLAQNASQLIIDSNKFCSQPDVSKWTPQDWAKSSATYAIYTNTVDNSTISRNTISNVENGIALSGSSLLATNNTIDYFVNDGIQFTSSNTIISNNRITNHYGKWSNGYHHDGMQGWTAWNEDRTCNVTIDSNVVLASTGVHRAIPAVPTGDGDDYMHGISIFDGKWSNVTVTNNVVAAASYHGITMTGVSNSRILNNTVVQQAPSYKTWLKVAGDSVNVNVRNNIAHSFSLPEKGVRFDSNVAFSSNWQDWQKGIPVVKPENTFVKWQPKTATFDFQLATKSPAVGAGNKSDYAKFDILYRQRNAAKVDLGAYLR